MFRLHASCLGLILQLTVVSVLAAQRVIDCGACHPAIAEEWRGSLHSRAWNTEAFRQDARRHTGLGGTSCGCHAPAAFVPDSIGSKPYLRADTLETGVDCIACHMDRGLTAYSNGRAASVPHCVRTEKAFSEGRFCTGCHSWGQAVEADCQDCHMPSAAGPSNVASGADSTAGHRSHRWPGSLDPEFVRGAQSLDAVRDTRGQLVLTLANLLSVHAFPQETHRRAELLLFGQDDKKPLWREGVRLAADSSARYVIDPAASPAGSRVELRYYPVPEVWPDSFHLLESRMIR
jgi:hypothetical protein